MNLGFGLSLTRQRPSKVVKNFNFTTALPSGATFTRASAASYFPASGAVASAATNVARFDYDSITRAALGLLLETTARTNKVKYSEDFTNAVWAKSALTTASGNAVVAPDGTTTADTLTFNNPNFYNYDLYQSMTGYTVGATLVFEGWVKLGTATNFCVVVNNGVAWNTITSGPKTFTSADGLNTSNWTRISLSFVVPATGNVNLHLGCNAQTGLTQQTAGTVHVWGFQITEAAGSYIPTTSAAVTQAVEALSLPLTDGIWDITTTDTTGSTTTRKSVVSGYPVTPRSGQTHVTSVRASLVASYSGYDTDARDWLHANQLVSLTGRTAVNATFVAIKASSVPFADVAFAGLAPGRNLDTGTTVKMAGGWTAATAISGVLSSSSLMRTGDPYGLYTNDGATGASATYIDFTALPLGSIYAVGGILRPYGNPNSDRGIFCVASNSGAMKQLSATGLGLNADNDTNFTRGLKLSLPNAVGFIQEASSVGRALGEYGYERTTALNVTGTNTFRFGTQMGAGAVGNLQASGVPSVILEAVAVLKNPTVAKWNALLAILKSTLCVQDARPVAIFPFTGQSQASFTGSNMLSQIMGQDADWKGRFVQQVYTHSNQPIQQWIGTGPYSRQGYYTSDLLPVTGSINSVIKAAETRAPYLGGLFWFHGEADAGAFQGLDDATAEARANAYQVRLQQFVDFIRADYPGLPIVVFQIDWITVASHTLTASEVSRLATIRAAQAAVVAANTGMALVDTRGMARDPADGVHLTTAGCYTAMVAAWTAMKALL